VRLEQRGGVAIAFMATVLGIALLIAAWEYLFSRVRTARGARILHNERESHEKAAIGWRNLIRWRSRRGADHENDDEGAAFCGAQIGASDQGAVRSGDGGGECSTGTGDGNRSAMCGTA